MLKTQAPYRFVIFLSLILFLGSISYAFAFGNLTISGEVDMDFDEIEYTGGATGQIRMGTNGNISYLGSFSGNGIGTAGQFLVTSSFGVGLNVSVACDTSATLTNGSGNAVTLNNIEFVLGSGNRTSFGNGRACQGTALPILPLVITGGTATRTVYIGGQLNISSPIASAGGYSTANSGGSPITFIVLRL